MSIFLKGTPMPSIATSRDGEFARIPVDIAQTSFFEGREFRTTRKITTPKVYRFTAPVEFILSRQDFTVATGEYEFKAWRAADVTASGSWTEVPIFGKNISNSRQLYNGAFYNRQCSIQTGGAITVLNPDNYSDFAWLKTSNASGQQVSISDQTAQGRYLAAGTYYLQFTGVGTGSYSLEWEERP